MFFFFFVFGGPLREESAPGYLYIIIYHLNFNLSPSHRPQLVLPLFPHPFHLLLFSMLSISPLNLNHIFPFCEIVMF